MKNTSRQDPRAKAPLHPAVKVRVPRAPLTLGDLISAAYETLGETRAVARVLRSEVMSRQIGRKLVFL